MQKEPDLKSKKSGKNRRRSADVSSAARKTLFATLGYVLALAGIIILLMLVSSCGLPDRKVERVIENEQTSRVRAWWCVGFCQAVWADHDQSTDNNSKSSKPTKEEPK